MSERKWVRASLQRLSRELGQAGHAASAPTVGRLLRKLGFGLRADLKSEETGSNHPDRDTQFSYIAKRRAAFVAAGEPVISVDTKKKDLIGNFENAGQAWGAQAEQVNVHDFPSEAEGRALPYGIYDVAKNRGWVMVGQSADTPEFAVEAIASWWEEEGRESYPNAKRLLILADGGGSNGARSRVWKQQVQERLADRLGAEVTVCHYPRGCSKHNPIEHRLFSFISLNWAGKPLRSFEALLGFIRNTTTTAGLKVKAVLKEKVYTKGRRVSDAEMKTIELERHEDCPAWNYTIRPRLTNA
jgi:Rhodopirellula transposase DDE domain